jgi:hypothetical protein
MSKLTSSVVINDSYCGSLIWFQILGISVFITKRFFYVSGKSMKHYISLGENCHVARTLKSIGLRNEAYPFDWVFTSPQILLDCIENDFTTFMNKQYHTEHPSSTDKSGHSLYGETFFNNKNILDNKDYEYYERCIARFKDVMSNDDEKIVVHMTTNNLKPNNSYCDNVGKLLQEALQKYGNNVKFVYIRHIVYDGYSFQPFIVTSDRSLTFVILSTGVSNGVRFTDRTQHVFFDTDLRKLLLAL